MRTNQKQTNFMGLFALSLMLVVLILGCSDGSESTGGDDGGDTCTSDADCPEGFLCGANQFCIPEADCACTSDENCPPGMICSYCECVQPGDDDPVSDGDTDTATEQDTDPEQSEDSEDPLPDGDDDAANLPAAIQATPVNLVFSPLASGEEETQNLTVLSTGDGTLKITDIYLSDQTSADFSFERLPELPYSLPSAQSLNINVLYSQSNMGFDGGRIIIESNAENVDEGRLQVELRSEEIGTPNLLCEPSPVDFELADLAGSAQTRVVTCFNTRENQNDNNVLVISNPKITPSDMRSFKVDSATANQIYIRTGSSADIPVVFDPDSTGFFEASLTFDHNAGNETSPFEIPLTGEGGSASLTLDIDEEEGIIFPDTRVGTIKDKTLTLRNEGAFPLTISNITKSASCGDIITLNTYNLLDGGTFTLATGQTAQIQVLFEPESATCTECEITIISNDYMNQMSSIPVQGCGTQFQLYALPDPVQFEGVRVGTTAVRDVQVINGGNIPITVTGVNINSPSGVFQIDNTSAPYTLERFNSQNYQIQFLPMSEQDYQGTLILTVDDEEYSSLEVELTGSGALPHLAMTPNRRSYDFGEVKVGADAEYTVMLENTGKIPLVISGQEWSSEPTPAGVLSAIIQGGTDIAPLSFRNLVFGFSAPNNPSGSLPMQVNGDYRFYTNDRDNSIVTIELSGTIVNPFVEVHPLGMNWDFGSRVPGNEADPIEVTITNGGSGDLTINDIYLTLDSSSAFRIENLSQAMPIDLRPSGKRAVHTSVSLSLHFLPPTYGLYEGTLVISNNGYIEQDYRIALSGFGGDCEFGTHDCGGECVSNNALEHCGSRCVPCPEVEYAEEICREFDGGYTCDYICDDNFERTNDGCEPVDTTECCGVDCLNCTTDLPEYGIGICDNGECSFECEDFYHKEGSACVLNDTAACCGRWCNACPTRANAVAICTPELECNFECLTDYANCNGAVGDGCEAYLTTSTYHCGSCNNRCSADYGTSYCTDGECDILSCDFGRADCNGDFDDGCETNIASDRNNCGGCDRQCLADHGTGRCVTGECEVQTCDYGWQDCNGIFSDGCETHILTNPNHCGECNFGCTVNNGVAGCSEGICAVAQCNEGYGDCDSQASNGCETNIMTNPNHCGECNNFCDIGGGSGSCVAGDCVVSACDVQGREDCDEDFDNGCETDTLTNVEHCGGCGNVCDLTNASEMCVNGECRVRFCDNGWGNCDDNHENGCEQDIHSDLDNCGGCDSVCGTYDNMEQSVCVEGTCDYGECQLGWGNCNGVMSDGCEHDIYSDVNNCGACNARCQLPFASPSCELGECVIDECLSTFKNCDDEDFNGCETDISTDDNNCGDCDSLCEDNPPDYYYCSGSACVLNDCGDGWGDCDITVEGCETNIDTNVNHCGGCDKQCNYPFVAQHSCVDGNCVPQTCDYEEGNEAWVDCDGFYNTGCEVNLFNEVEMCNEEDMWVMHRASNNNPEIEGDNEDSIGQRTKTYSGHGTQWLKLKVVESTGSGIYFCHDIYATVYLSVPAGANYDLFIYKTACTVWKSSTNQIGDETAEFCSNDNWTADDDITVYIEVRFQGFTSGTGASYATGCEEWSIYATGNTRGFDGSECDPNCLFKSGEMSDGASIPEDGYILPENESAPEFELVPVNPPTFD